MYATTAILKNSRFSGRIIGTHQQLDKWARRGLTPLLQTGQYFPSESAILYFEGSRGPDGLKRKSPEQDEPTHFWIPDDKQDKMLAQLQDYYHNLTEALAQGDNFRAAFQAAWLAHFVADSLTPAHHFSLSDVKQDLMTNKEMIKFFGEPIKGLMHGQNAKETLKNNWKYYGAGGYMNKHMAFEYRIACIVATAPAGLFTPEISPVELENTDFFADITAKVQEVFQLKLYDEFCSIGWTPRVDQTIRQYLLPLVVREIMLAWYSTVRQAYGNQEHDLETK